MKMQNVPELWAPTYWLIQQRESVAVRPAWPWHSGPAGDAEVLWTAGTPE